MIALDFETYYDINLTVKKMGPERYAQELIQAGETPYCVAIYGKDIRYSGSIFNAPWDKIKNEPRVFAHNARFDSAIAKSNIPVDLEWACTADLAAFNQSPRALDKAALCLLKETVSKDPRKKMKGKHFNNLNPEEKKEIIKYCQKDAELCYRLAEKYYDDWPLIERRISEVNRKMGRYGVCLDTKYIETSCRLLKQIMFDAEKKLPWRNDPDLSTAILSSKEACKLCNQHNLPIPKRINDKGKEVVTWAQSDPDVQLWEEQFSQKYPWVAAMRDYRKANILLKKLIAMQSRVVGDNIMPTELLYFGAHTGRFSGGGGVNMQNLPGRRENFVNLRRAIKARPGHKLVVIDWSQIEPRLLRWVVKDTRALNLLKQGINMYEAYAIQHFEWKKIGMLKKIDPNLYAMAKAVVLGAGYGCGGVKYRAVAKAMAGLDLTEEEAFKQINLFRRDNPKIVALWNQLLFAARLRAQKQQDFKIQLPSGRCLHYFNMNTQPSLRASVYRDGSRVSYLHGGLLTENYIQAIARDVFAEALIRLYDNKINCLFHVHDEYILEVPEGDRERQKKQISQILLESPSWLKDCPLDFEIKNWGDCYV